MLRGEASSLFGEIPPGQGTFAAVAPLGGARLRVAQVAAPGIAEEEPAKG